MVAFLVMEFFYQREENDDQIEITFFGLPFINVLFWFVIFISLLSKGHLTSFAFLSFGVGLTFYLGLSWRALLEIRNAMLDNGVTVVGSQLSLQNPMKILIRK